MVSAGDGMPVIKRSYDPLAFSVRDSAVANVDARHGYTVEFSPSPEAHREEYDREEEHLRAMWRRLGCSERADAR